MTETEGPGAGPAGARRRVARAAAVAAVAALVGGCAGTQPKHLDGGGGQAPATTRPATPGSR